MLTSLSPVTVAGIAQASGGLRFITVTANGTVVLNLNYAQGDNVTQTPFGGQWTPPAAGQYVLAASAEDWTGNVQLPIDPITVTVALNPPSIAWGKTVFALADSFKGWVNLGGTASAEGDAIVSAQTAPVAAGAPASFDGSAWKLSWQPSGNLDGGVFPMTAVITDTAGLKTTAEANITVDLVAPRPFTVTLTAGAATLADGATVRDAGASLTASWTASSDGAGLVPYLAGWTNSPMPDKNLLSTVPVAGPLTVSVTGGEAQAWFAHVIARDVNGNETAVTRGPVYTDSPLTPDRVSELTYTGWMDSGASLVSADFEAAAFDPAVDPQRLHASWDADTLRLVWTGATWDTDGELFIYLDRTTGGASTLLDPWATGGSISFPAGFTADALIRVQSNVTATLQTWNGTGWDAATALGPDSFNFEPAAQRTDVLLPFSLLGLNSSTSVGVLAVASEKDSLKMWAAAPDKNPLNSSRVLNAVARARNLDTFALAQALLLGPLSSGLRPDGGKPAGADVRTAMGSSPSGLRSGFLLDDWYDVLTPGGLLDANGDGVADTALPADTLPAPVGPGQAISYTISYANAGDSPAAGVTLLATAHGGLRLTGGATTQTIPLGSLSAGVSGTVQIDGYIDSAFTGASAELTVNVSDNLHGEFEWLWTQHPVDAQNPAGVGITSAPAYASPGLNTVAGEALDASGIKQVELTAVASPGGATNTIICPDDGPLDNFWSCNWDPGNLAGVDQFTLTAVAVDLFGNRSAPSAPAIVQVDVTPPAVALDPAVDNALADGYLNASELLWKGSATDNRSVTAVRFCVGSDFSPDCNTAGSSAPGASVTWSADWNSILAGDGVSVTVSLYSLDAGSNRSPSLVRQTVVDTVPPALSVVTPTLIAGDVTTIQRGQEITGTVADGSGIAALVASLQLPDGTSRVDQITVTGNTWSYVPLFDQAGSHILQFTARDRAGNESSLGAFTLNVQGGARFYVNANRPALGPNGALPAGISWADAYFTLQDALAAAKLTGDEVWVAAGTYYPDTGLGLTDNNKGLSFTLRDGVSIYGGFAGVEASRDARNWRTNVTVLSGDIDQNDTNSAGSRIGNSEHVITAGAAVGPTTRLDGFTIAGGRAVTGPSGGTGGGLYVDGGSPTLANLTVFNNRGGRGAGMFSRGGNPALVNVLFLDNRASAGGGLRVDGGSPTLTNVTFAGNVAGQGGALHNSNNATPVIRNSILWGNLTDPVSSDPLSNSVRNDPGSVPTFANSVIQGSGGSGSPWKGAAGTDGGGNLDADPLYVQAANPDTGSGDAHLQAGSPAIDAGANSANTEPKDLDAKTRIVDGNGDGSAVIDMGAYERDASCLAPAAPQVTIAVVSGTVQLTWQTVPGANAYDVYRATEPYFGPTAPYATGVGSPWQDPDGSVIGNAAANYTYIVRARGCATADSQRTSEFEFPVIPGQ